MGASQRFTVEILYETAKEKGGKCLSTEYINSNHKYTWECEKGHRWDASLSKIRHGGWCPDCFKANRGNNRRKYTLQDMQELAKKNGGECLSESFESITKHLRWRCSEGHEWEATASPMIHRAVWCKECRLEQSRNPELVKEKNGKMVSFNSRRLTIEDAKELAKTKNGKCLSKKYVNAKDNLVWCCEEGHVFNAAYSNVKSGSWCRECAGLSPRTIEDARWLARKKNGLCLSGEYVNAHSKLLWKCEEGHVWEATYDNISSGKWCLACSGNAPKTIQEVRDFAIKRGGKCLSLDYVNAHEKLKWECANGHSFEMTYNNAQQGKWCKYCHLRLNEQKTRFIIERFLGERFPSRRDVFGNLYELDGYSEKLKLAFEFQGIQHSKHREFFHRTETAFQEQIDRDNEKRELAKEMGILLLEVPYKLDTDDKKIDYIFDFLVGNHFSPHSKHFVREQMSEFYLKNSNYEELKELAGELGGELLSNYYNGATYDLEWKCRRGHLFSSPPTKVKAGRWCPECKKYAIAEAKRKYTIEDMKTYAIEKGGECLSDSFEWSTDKLKWKCSKGHVWKTSFTYIINGSWCPECAGNLPNSIEKALEHALSKNGKCLSTTYERAADDFEWECEKGHQWTATYHSVVNHGSWCPECNNARKRERSRKNTIEDMQRLAAERNGKCLSDTYKNTRDNLLWECEKGHRFEKSLGNLRKGQWCKYCKYKKPYPS